MVNMKPIRIGYVILWTVEFLPFNRLFIRGLEENGTSISLLSEKTRNALKYWHSMRAMWRIRHEVDAYCIGYLSHRLVPGAYIISRLTRKPLFFNAGHSIYEAEALDKHAGKRRPVLNAICWFLDYVAFQLADTVFLESATQCDYIASEFHVPRGKLVPLYYSADDHMFYRSPNDPPHDPSQLRVLWRGMMHPSNGAPLAFETMTLLKDTPITLTVRAGGTVQPLMWQFIKDHDLANVVFTDHHFTAEELRAFLVSGDVLLGNFGSHPRATRSIQNRVYEALMLGIPLVSARAAALEELVTDGEHALLVDPNDPRDIADKLRLLAQDSPLRERLSTNARKLYEDKLTPKHMGARALEHMRKRV